MTPTPTLHVSRADERILFRLEVPERDAGEPLQQEVVQLVDGPTLAALRASAATLLRLPGGAGFAAEAVARGQVLHRALIPTALHAPLAALAGPLLISTSLHGIPWELLHDGTEFWGIRYAIGRRIVTERSKASAATHVRRERPRALIIASDPSGDLPSVRAETEAIVDLLARSTDCSLVAGRLATFDVVTRQLRREFDIVHLCGHVVRRPDGVALLLAGGTPLSAAVVEASLAGRPLVFLNGCASGHGADTAASDAEWEESLSGFAAAFLVGGAIAVVGTLADVADAGAADLAREFYSCILESRSVGESLRETRARVRANRPDSPIWLQFALYGNPAQLLALHSQPNDGTPPRSAPVAAQPDRVHASHGWSRKRVATALAAAVIVATIAASWLLRPARPEPVVIGVMEVRDRDGSTPQWMRELTRDGLNTIFSKVGPLRVYSKEKIDFYKRARGLSEIEVAESLKMTKMLATTLSTHQSDVHIELQIIDIQSGLLEASDSVRGSDAQLIELQNELAVKALAALGIESRDPAFLDFLAARTNDTLASYRLLTETLGAPAPARPEPSPSPAPAPGVSWLEVLAAPAYAADGGADEAIRGVLQRYRRALESRSVDDLAQVYVDMPDSQRQALARYFANAKDLTVRIVDVEIAVEGDEALATFTREDSFTDARSGRPMRLEVRTEQRLSKRAGEWRLVGAGVGR